MNKLRRTYFFWAILPIASHVPRCVSVLFDKVDASLYLHLVLAVLVGVAGSCAGRREEGVEEQLDDASADGSTVNFKTNKQVVQGAHLE